MLGLKNIVKNYETGNSTVEALKGISLEFRKSEFVSILGQSGCGKTTLLNIIGGLDRYTSGDLLVNGKSTMEFTDADWDSYRNHSIGFVFQSYNLIPHQSVLANVELALTLSGVSRAERRRKAAEALKKVGLEGLEHKKPNQMSGGQMQRVAIARALVNDPEIILADEPTGALDSETSVQIMELLKEVARDRLVIMVTHNPDLANEYSTRIIRLLDGKVTDDSNPYDGSDEIRAEKKELSKKEKRKEKRENRTSMSFLTAISLSLNNLMTKKGRTLMVSFAGSIGIIGIALILSLSNGIQLYINSVQEDTLSSYPITLEAQTMDMSSAIQTFVGEKSEGEDHALDKVYSNPVMYKLMNSMSSSSIQKNDLGKFKKHLEKNSEKFSEYISAVQYKYDVNFNVYTKNDKGVAKSDLDSLFKNMYGNDFMNAGSIYSSGMSLTLWQQILGGENGEPVNELLKSQYDVVYGKWPEKYDEILVVVNERNEVSDLALYSLGLKSDEDMKAISEKVVKGEQIDDSYESWTYEDICSRVYRVVADADYYQADANGGYSNIGESEAGMNYLYDNGIELKVCGIIRPNPDASATMLQGGIAYTSALVEKMIDRTDATSAVKAQLSSPDTDVITGLPFKPENYTEPDNAEKVKDAKEYLAKLDTASKAAIAFDIMSVPEDAYVKAQVDAYMAGVTREKLEASVTESYAEQMNMDKEKVSEYISKMSDDELFAAVKDAASESVKKQYSEGVKQQFVTLTDEQKAMMLTASSASFSDEKFVYIYDSIMPAKYSESTYEENLELLGVTDRETPSGINLYASTFENKDLISDMISEYNSNAEKEEDEITYTDYVGIIMSSVTTIINAISYVLIAFVAISLVVSSIMIAIITYISVLERTKEIGVLRSIGASKRDITHVFNAETVIIGFVSGIIGIVATLLLTIPINIIIQALTNVNVYAALPVMAGIILVIICVVLNVIAGLVPSLMAAKKDPVVALRTE